MPELPKHPIQPLYKDEDGTIRFRPNKIVQFLLNTSKCDMNDLGHIPFDREDREQFAQLIGYSLCGASELPYVKSETLDEAEAIFKA